MSLSIPAAPLLYTTGDATQPWADGRPHIIAHVCNDIGRWGSGFVMALSGRWPEPEEEYRKWHANGPDFRLGHTQLVLVEKDLTVANMIAQHGTITSGGDGGPPIRYRELGGALRAVSEEAGKTGASVHMPRIGCGLAGGRWELVEPIIEWSLCRRGIPVTVYDLPGSVEDRVRRFTHPS